MKILTLHRKVELHYSPVAKPPNTKATYWNCLIRFSILLIIIMISCLLCLSVLYHNTKKNVNIFICYYECYKWVIIIWVNWTRRQIIAIHSCLWLSRAPQWLHKVIATTLTTLLHLEICFHSTFWNIHCEHNVKTCNISSTLACLIPCVHCCMYFLKVQLVFKHFNKHYHWGETEPALSVCITGYSRCWSTYFLGGNVSVRTALRSLCTAELWTFVYAPWSQWLSDRLWVHRSLEVQRCQH